MDPCQIYELNIQLLPILDEAMKPTDQFEVEMIPNIKVGQSFEALISHVANPFDFYIQLRTTENVYRSLMNEMEVFYCSSESSKKYKIRGIEPGIYGLPCVALYWNDEGKSKGWHRAIVNEIYDSDTVGVFYVSNFWIYLSCRNLIVSSESSFVVVSKCKVRL